MSRAALAAALALTCGGLGMFWFRPLPPDLRRNGSGLSLWARSELVLEDWFDARDGLAQPCLDRTPEPRLVDPGLALELPRCFQWQRPGPSGLGRVQDRGLAPLAAALQIAPTGAPAPALDFGTAGVDPVRLQGRELEVLRYERETPLGRLVKWRLETLQVQLALSVVVPPALSLSPKVRQHLQALEAAALSARNTSRSRASSPRPAGR